MGDLYGNLVGRLRPVVEGQPMGLAQADNLLAHPQRARRAAAWHAIQAAWGRSRRRWPPSSTPSTAGATS